MLIRISGHYYFIEASAPRTEGDKARLVSELFDPTSSRNGRCLQFYRHMYGTAVGTLNVYVKTGPGNGSDVEQLVWTNAGNQGNSWIQGQAPVFSSKPFRVSVFYINQFIPNTPFLYPQKTSESRDVFRG